MHPEVRQWSVLRSRLLHNDHPSCIFGRIREVLVASKWAHTTFKRTVNIQNEINVHKSNSEGPQRNLRIALLEGTSQFPWADLHRTISQSNAVHSLPLC